VADLLGVVGLTSFLILRMWFGKAVQDFNSSIQAQGAQGPQLVADTGNAFTSTFPLPPLKFNDNLLIDGSTFAVIWVAHAFWVVPVMISLTKYNVKA
jgi:hypothetical protein